MRGGNAHDLAFEEAAARRRREEEHRPRDGWRLAGVAGTQVWVREADGCAARVWGRQLSPPWHYEVFDKAGEVLTGEAACLAAAMQEAERLITSGAPG